MLEEKAEQIISELLLPFAHEAILIGLKNADHIQKMEEYDCIAVVEARTNCWNVDLSRWALKDALVSLVGLRVAGALGGKGFFVLEGAQHDIEAALETVSSVVEEKGGLFHKEVIARPHPEAVEWMLRRAPFRVGST